jgi:hypothetical protein
MAAYVKVLEAGGCGPPPGPWPGEEMLSPRLLGEGNPQAWRLLCTSVVELAQSGARSALEIFICMAGGELVTAPDRAALARLLQMARDHAWGASLFVVASSQLDLRRAPWQARESRELWLRTALEGKVLDLLEIEYDPLAPAMISGDSLREAADIAAKRQRPLRDLRGVQGNWRCVVDPQKKLLESLLSTWVQYDGFPLAPNLVIVIDDVLKQPTAVRKARKRFPGSNFVVVTLREPSPDLERHCINEGLGKPIVLRGELELSYFLLRLNENPLTLRAAAAVGPQEGHLLNDVDERVHEVELAVARIFGPIEPVSEPMLVVTSAFNPEEPAQCLEAARDVGRVVERYPIGAPLAVEPAITLGRLFQIMDRWKTFHIWVHLGHGAGIHGLHDVDGNLATPEMWLQCFQERHRDLALAVFLTCFSSPIAHLFAQAGVSVAIGFEDEVESHMCRELVVDVLDSVVAHGTRPSEVIQGFRRGYFRITVQEQMLSRPIAYYLRAS